jgi:hypothetical protein
MDVLVLSSARKLLSRSILGSSLAGDGLLVRLRSTSIGLLGLVAAVGLGLIAFISQLGWPGVFSQPIPGPPAGAGAVHDAIALTRPTPALGVSNATHALSRAAVRRAVHGHGGGRAPSGSPAIGGSRQLAATGGETTTPASPPAPAPAPAAEPAPQPPVPAGEATSQPPPTASSPGPATSSTPKTGSQTSASTAKSDAKTTTKRHSAAKSKSHGSGSASEDAAKPERSTPGKSGEDHGGRPQEAPEPPPAPSKPSAPPAAAPPPKAPPEAPEYGDAKGEGGPGKSDWHRH